MIILTCCSVVKIRLIFYFACGILIFLTLIALILLCILSALAPNVGQMCAYTDLKLATSAGASTFFTNLGLSDLGTLLGNCMSDGSGIIMDKINPSFNDTFSDIVKISRNVLLFNSLIPSYSTANLASPFTSATAIITKVKNADSI